MNKHTKLPNEWGNKCMQAGYEMIRIFIFLDPFIQ